MIADWWSPSTEAGLAIQLLVTLAIAGAVLVLVRHERALVLLVIGLTLVILGWYGNRALH